MRRAYACSSWWTSAKAPARPRCRAACPCQRTNIYGAYLSVQATLRAENAKLASALAQLRSELVLVRDSADKEAREHAAALQALQVRHRVIAFVPERPRLTLCHAKSESAALKQQLHRSRELSEHDGAVAVEGARAAVRLHEQCAAHLCLRHSSGAAAGALGCP